MKDLKKYFFIFSLIISTPVLLAETGDDISTDLKGTVWQLVKNGSPSSSFGSGQVVYFYPVTHTTLIEVENSKLGILFLWLMEETLFV